MDRLYLWCLLIPLILLIPSCLSGRLSPLYLLIPLFPSRLTDLMDPLFPLYPWSPRYLSGLYIL